MAQVQCPFDPSSFQDFNFYPGVGRCALRVPESVKLGVVASDAQCLCTAVGQEPVNWRGNCDGQRYLLGFLASFLGLGGHIAKQTDSTAIMQLWKSQLLNPVQDLWAHGATSLVILSQVFSRSIAVSTGEQVALSSGVCPYLFALAYPYSFIFAPRKPNLELSNWHSFLIKKQSSKLIFCCSSVHCPFFNGILVPYEQRLPAFHRTPKQFQAVSNVLSRGSG